VHFRPAPTLQTQVALKLSPHTTTRYYTSIKAFQGSTIDMDSTKVVSKRKKQGAGRNFFSSPLLIAGLLIIVVTVSVLYYVYSSPQSGPPESEATSEEYSALLRRAKALAAKYSELTGRDVPEQLTQNLKTVAEQRPANPGAVSGLTNAIFNRGANKDLVIGMAQDTDAKNFVSRPSRFFLLHDLTTVLITLPGGVLQVASKVTCVIQNLRLLWRNSWISCCLSVSTADAVIFVNEPVPERHQQIAKDARIICT
jgi:hypothetical protein